MVKLIECVPNFSEGKDLELVADIVSAIKTAKVLNVHSDPDHNRTVVTIVGEPDAVQLAAFDLTQRAMQLLDINKHEGEHPYIGVVDVVPFIPIKDISVAETVDVAREFGEKVATKFALPVYFYGAAAKIAEHKELPNVRRGGYKVLKEEFTNARRKPDLGDKLHPHAGALAVGVRDFLIAFNVNLETSDIDLAKSIAKNIREKSGGLPGVRALGISLTSRNITQVSINVCDHRTTSLKQVFDEVGKWARTYDVNILESELVGMIPQEAVFEGMQEYLKLPGFSSKQILEHHVN